MSAYRTLQRALLTAALLLPLSQPTFAAAISRASDATLTVSVNNGTLIKLDKPASSVFVADPNIADIQVKSSRLVYVFGKAPGTTTVYAVSGTDDVLFSAQIVVSHDLTQARAALQKMMPGNNIDVQQMNGVLVLTGNARSPVEANDVQQMAQKLIGKDSEVLNRLTVATPPQVNIRVRVAEVSRDVAKQLGFNWEGTLGIGKSVIGLQTSRNVFDIVKDQVLNTPIKEFKPLGTGIGSAFGSIVTGRLDLNYIIDALETEGFLTVLAEPNLTSLSGEFASFLAGGEFPIPVPQERGVITIEYRKFGVGLQFTPTVLADNSINLKIQPEVSQLSSAGAITLNGFNVPALTTRRAETTVELASGQSFAIAGLLQNNIERELSKFPGLGDLPILGALFRSDRFRRQETELIIIVTPYLVQPTSKKIPIPQDGLQIPNDGERNLDGQSYRAVPPAPAPAADTTARAGFMLN
ncbi:type II and III secretion system protein family protein [Govanella unica]|uniref:Type II and III secretion system protein family protein n=1 Tax=Govanella unica TaxID=2975056 RepID=A0A9X3Z848_9PROT|nr:type II and III secretion system protein family protein [Govania unica]MDA5194970.1 type II and III secretion system protein family protein [Govania unica]